MQAIEEKIKQVHEKLSLLIRQKNALTKENEWLRQELETAKKTATATAGQYESLQSQLDIHRYTQTAMSEEEKKAFEKKINSYLKEIDKCIALLSV
ncbi:MAG: hypothetical protein QM727_01995 [Niabella sp.]